MVTKRSATTTIAVALPFYEPPILERSQTTERTSIYCSGSKKGAALAVAWRSPFGISRWTIKVPQSKGGSDHFDNLQLLCGACNSVKGDRDHAVRRY